jgi:hypothetical protein
MYLRLSILILTLTFQEIYNDNDAFLKEKVSPYICSPYRAYSNSEKVSEEKGSKQVLERSISLSFKKVEIKGRNSKGPYKLPHKFIIENSVTVIKDTVQLGENDFYINNRKGTIFFYETLKEDEVVSVSYSFFPFNIEEEYKRRNIGPFLEGESVVTKERPPVESGEEYEESNIILGGAKTFSIGVNSSGDFSFDQSLKINIRGEITEGLSISGVLSDENTPLEPEGTTQSLEELDRIYVSVDGKKFRATLGDYVLHYQTPVRSLIKRDLIGITGDIKQNEAGVNVALGIPRGKFNSMYIKGIESKQGPYQLKSKEGEDDIVVVAGTETVYLNGIIMKRGMDNDYTIDYSLAQITFTFRQMITEESDIVVEFQYTRIGFQRSLYSANITYQKSNYQAGCFLVQDVDEISQTEGFELTEEQKRLISTVGDDTSENWVDSGVYKGKGKGDYSFEDSFYIYQGYNGGEWDVIFTYVGDGNGDYTYSDSLSGFIYVGSNNGDYTSTIRVPLPEKERFVGFNGGVSYGKKIKLDGELFGSDYDRNALSPIDDNDNIGYHTDLNGVVNIFESGVGNVDIVGKYKHKNRNFNPLMRFEESNFENRWNIERCKGMENIKEGGFQYEKKNVGFFRETVSFLKRESVEATLRDINACLRRKGLPEAEVNSSNVSIQGDSTLSSVKRIGIDASHSFFNITPELFGKQEIKVGDEKKRWREGGGTFSVSILENTNTSIGYSKRYDELFNRGDKKYEMESRATTESFSVTTENKPVLVGNINIVSRQRKYTEQFPGINTELLLVEFNTKSKTFRRKLDIETNYSVTGKNSILFKEIFYEVEENSGDYSKDTLTGEYYEDTLGNYKKRIEAIGEGNPVTAVRTYLRIGLVPGNIFSCNITALLMEENRGEDKLPIYLLRLNSFLNASSTVTGKQALDGNISLYPLDATSLSYTFNFIKGMNNEIVSSGRKNYSDRNEFRIEQRLTQESKLAIEYLRKRKITESISNGLERVEFKEEYAPEYSQYIFENLRGILRLTKGRIEIEEPLWYNYLGLIAIKQESINPSFELTVMNSALVKGGFSIIRNSSQKSENDFPSDVVTFYPLGITSQWSVDATTSLSTTFSINFYYRGLNKPNQETIHSANAELRADF